MDTTFSSLRARTSATEGRPNKRRRILCNSPLAVAALALLGAPAAATAAPDPLMPHQWALAQPNALGAREAWTQSSGAGVVVAVLDSGIQLDHPDLAANLWTNPDEVAGNGRDDDANGIVDDVHGANMFDRSAYVGDDNGHGTHVAGIIAAGRDNGVGGSGLAPEAKILAVKVLDATMSGNTDALARGIRYAVDEGARILNVSINGDGASESLQEAVRYAGERGAVVVASAGNKGRDIDVLPSYPASLSDPAILSVAATNEEGGLWEQSNSGRLSVDLAAPGVSILSTARESGYQSRVGTSAATPFVSASLALLAAARPELPMSELAKAIIDTTRRADLLEAPLGGGRLDVAAAMRRVLAGRPSKPGASYGPILRLRTKLRSRTGERVTLRWSTIAASGVTRWRISLDGRVIATVPASRARISRRITRSGRHRWRVVGFDDNGTKIVAARRAFRLVGRT